MKIHNIADDCVAFNTNAANKMTTKEIEELEGECHYCLAGKVGDCLCTRGYGAWYGNPDPMTRLLEQVRIKGKLEWVPIRREKTQPSDSVIRTAFLSVACILLLIAAAVAAGLR